MSGLEKPKIDTLKTSLQDWQDDVCTMHAIALCLGIMTPPADVVREKHVFWSNHPVGEMLYAFLQKMVEVGIIEFREVKDGDNLYRWNPSYKGSWEV